MTTLLDVLADTELQHRLKTLHEAEYLHHQAVLRFRLAKLRSKEARWEREMAESVMVRATSEVIDAQARYDDWLERVKPKPAEGGKDLV